MSDIAKCDGELASEICPLRDDKYQAWLIPVGT